MMQESGEMYLETIYLLCQKNTEVHSIDVAEFMGFSKPSVSRGVNILKKDGYLEIDDEHCITLTEKGLMRASKVYDCHKVLTKWLMKIGVSEDTATQDACKMEHVISDETLEALKKYVE